MSLAYASETAALGDNNDDDDGVVQCAMRKRHKSIDTVIPPAGCYVSAIIRGWVCPRAVWTAGLGRVE
eukprot:scaffold261711_cov42-Prasinocladus_malaysianus.AAC.1